MRIALVGTGGQPIPPPGYGGIERILALSAEGLQEAGHKVLVVNNGLLIEPGGWWIWQDLRFAIRSLRQVPRDSAVVASNAIHAIVYRLLGRRPAAYMVHNPVWFLPSPPGPKRLRHSASLGLERLASRCVRTSVVFSEAQRLRLPPAARRRASLLYQPVADEGASPRYPRQVWDDRIALGLGIIHRRKRWHIAAGAAQSAGFRFRLVGPVADESYAAELRSFGTTVLGEVPRRSVLDELDGASVVLHPSASEVGTCLAVAEASSRARPLVVSPSVAEAVDGNGLVIPDGDNDAVTEDAWAKALHDLRWETCQAWSRRGRALYEARHAPSRFAAGLEAALRRRE